MNREKILSKAQSENVDERYLNITSKGISFSFVSSFVFIGFIALWNIFHNQESLIFGVILVFQTFIFTVHQYLRLPDRKIYLYSSVVLCIIFLTSLTIYILNFGV
jgi:hypothetical protein